MFVQVVYGRIATNLRLVGADRHYLGIRNFGVFNEFSKKVKGEVDRYLLSGMLFVSVL